MREAATRFGTLISAAVRANYHKRLGGVSLILLRRLVISAFAAGMMATIASVVGSYGMVNRNSVAAVAGLEFAFIHA